MYPQVTLILRKMGVQKTTKPSYQNSDGLKVISIPKATII